MRFPWVNTLLLLLILLQAITGYFGFTAGRPPERWLLWLHGIGAYAIVILLLWKGAIVLDVYGRAKRWTARRMAFALMAALLILTLLAGLFWTFYGPQYLGGFSLITVHILLAVLLVALVAWHAIAYRWVLRISRARDRRAFLRAATFSAAALFAWGVTTRARQLLALPGAGRRFTGSYERASFSPNLPSVSWIGDDPRPIDSDRWQLRISGAVQNPMTINYAQLLALAQTGRDVVLDCTGGWYSEQHWLGVPLFAILALTQPTSDARSISFESITGFNRRFSVDRADSMLLATHVAGQALSHGHGFPLRLVIPGERGVNWVKWITHIRLNTTGPHLQSPLPLQ